MNIIPEKELDSKVVATKCAIAEQVRRRMEERAITRFEVARQSGVSPNSIKRILEGKNTSIETIKRVVQVLGIRVFL